MSPPEVDNVRGWLGESAVLIPVKQFQAAKGRLAGTLSPTRRSQLARELATGVLRAARGMPVAVVCDDAEVADWARALHALVIWEPGRGLNGAVEAGVRRLNHLGVVQVAVVHGDLPYAQDLRWICSFAGITLIPDRHREGTNVVGLPANSPFTFSYGPGSFSRHLAESERLGLPRRVVHGSLLSWDVDVPTDLIALTQ